jgi:hypothetical protein
MIVMLGGYTFNRTIIHEMPLEQLGEVRVCDRSTPAEVRERDLLPPRKSSERSCCHLVEEATPNRNMRTANVI